MIDYGFTTMPTICCMECVFDIQYIVFVRECVFNVFKTWSSGSVSRRDSFYGGESLEFVIESTKTNAGA